MYIAVEDSESGYDLVGTMHYSLMGERSLFRVRTFLFFLLAVSLDEIQFVWFQFHQVQIML